jgi:hypothetical protein
VQSAKSLVLQRRVGYFASVKDLSHAALNIRQKKYLDIETRDSLSAISFSSSKE